MISTKSERKPLKSTIWLTDQITRKFKNRSLQNFQTWQFTSLSLRKQQRNGLNGTVKSMNCFLSWEEILSFVIFCWLAKFIAKRVCLFLRMKCYKNGGSVARGKTSSSCTILFPFNLKQNFCKHLLSNLFVIDKLRFLGQIFFSWVHETASSMRKSGSWKKSIEHKTPL